MTNWKNDLSKAGYRLTRPRDAVMRILRAASQPLMPLEIYQQAQAQNLNLGMVTVYRTLEVLQGLGLVERVHSTHDCQGYVLASPGHHHYLICRECECAVEFAGCDSINSLIQDIQAQTGFTVEEHLLQLSGLCPRCSQKSQKSLKET